MGFAFVVLLSGLIAHFIFERIEHFAHFLGAFIEHADISDKDRRDNWVPSELLPTFRSILEQVRLRRIRERELEETRIAQSLSEQLAHDIRSPLVALTMTLHDANLSTEQKAFIDAATDRIRHIANTLLKQGQAAAKREESLATIIQSICDEKRSQFVTQDQVVVEKQCPADLFANADANDLKRVFSNVLDNAFQAISKKGRITIQAQTEGNCILVRVSDTGKGISYALLPHLMKPRKTFGKPSGTGLGLYSAKCILQKWGGSLHLESEEGKGTTVSIRLQHAVQLN